MKIQFPFDKEKTLNIILYILGNLKRTDFHKVFKILYFSDREYISKYGMPITGDSYIAMEAGPVPSKVYDICKIVRGDSFSQDTENIREFLRVEDWMYLKANKPADLDKISPNEKDVVDKCIALYGDLTHDEIKEKSHDIAWRSTARDYAISFEDIARESGLDSTELQYINETGILKQFAHGVA